jgi:acyl-CoA synthetase (AMP-forming)/AMP-acid ligase II
MTITGLRRADYQGTDDAVLGSVGYPRPGMEVAVLHLLQRIARFKRPKRYLTVDQLPKNSYGKVLKRELRQRLATHRSD